MFHYCQVILLYICIPFQKQPKKEKKKCLVTSLRKKYKLSKLTSRVLKRKEKMFINLFFIILTVNFLVWSLKLKQGTRKIALYFIYYKVLIKINLYNELVPINR